MKFTSKIYSLLLLVNGFAIYSQEQDSIANRNNDLDEVVITGQYNAQSVRKSVFQVKVITREDIDRQAGNNLADLLNQTLNISIRPNNSSGKSQVQLFGLDFQYFKVLVDNIPIINDEGLGNNTDLTQINLDDIQQIEIVEGSMGVEYGANAVSGIINIISKKSSKYKWEITPYIQEETVGNEYNYFDEGRHIQSLKIGHNFNSKLYANAVITANDFQGFRNNMKGPNHLENDSLRGYEWLPKNQLSVKSLVNYSLNNHRFFYKFEFFDETTDRYGADVRVDYNPATDTNIPSATDDIFTSQRIFNHLNINGKFENFMNYDVSFSYQKQRRNVEHFNYRIRQQEKYDIENFQYESRDGFYTKGNFSKFLDNKTFDFQLGYEISEINGYASAMAGTFDGNNIDRRLGSYDVYASTEVTVNDDFSIRPGVRMLYSSLFDPQTAISLSSRYILKNGFELRAIVGSAPRLPNYEELYTYLVDVNHNVRGNENLKPEQGVSASFYVNKISHFKSGVQLVNNFSAWFLDISDKIDLIIVDQMPLAYGYTNISKHKTWGVSLTNSLKYKNLILNGGVTFSGVSQVIGSENLVDTGNLSNDDYLYGYLANGNVSYTFPKIKTVLSAYFKYNGPQYQFVNKTDDAGDAVLVRGKQNAYSMLDATIRKSFMSNRLEATIGARNLLDITRINTTANEGGAHTGPATSQLMGYGRSFFLKLLYKINL